MLFKLLVQIFEDTLILEHSLEFISIFEPQGDFNLEIIEASVLFL